MIKDLYDQANVEMFATSVRGRKAFAVEPKIRELKTKILKLNAKKLKITPTNIILSSSENTNNVQRKKYGLTPQEIEKKFVSNETFRTIFNIHQIERTKLVRDRLNRYNKKKYHRKKKKIERKFEH